MKPHPASTVVLVRQAASDIEVLLLLRNRQLRFNGDHWVFPGGRIDPQDYPDAACQQQYYAALNAAVRETQEEAGVVIHSDNLQHIAHWTTPEGYPLRFSTWFFIGLLYEPTPITVDQQEIVDYCWRTPRSALQASDSGELKLPVPTLQTLQSIAAYRDLRALSAGLDHLPVHVFPAQSPDYPKDSIPR